MTTIAIKTNPNQDSCFLVAKKIIKDNTKDVFRAIKCSLEWIKISFKSLSYSAPIKNLLTCLDGGMGALAIPEFASSLCTISHTISQSFKKSVTTTIKQLAIDSLRLLWSFFKICKTLATNSVIFLGKNIIPISLAGGSAFAVVSLYDASQQLDKIKNPANAEKNFNEAQRKASLNYKLFNIARCIGTCVIGVFVALKALIGFMAPGIVMTVLGTAILVSSVTSSYYKHSYALKFDK